MQLENIINLLKTIYSNVRIVYKKEDEILVHVDSSSNHTKLPIFLIPNENGWRFVTCQN